MNLPIVKWLGVTTWDRKLAPILADLEGKGEGAALDRDAATGTILDLDAVGQGQHDHVAAAPLTANDRKTGTIESILPLAVDLRRGTCRPGWHAQNQRESHRPGRPNPELNHVAERVFRLLVDGNPRAVHLDCDLARPVGGRHEAAIGGGHPKRRHELRPALVQICRTTAKIWLESKYIRRRPVFGPGSRSDGTEDLIPLLVVLVGSKVGGDRGRKIIVGNALEAVGEGGIAEDSKQLLETEHELDDRAELDSLGGVMTGQPLVAGKHVGRLAVVPIEICERGVNRVAVMCRGTTYVPNRGLFHAHCDVHDVGQMAKTRRVFFANRKFGKKLSPIERLGDHQIKESK